MRRREDIYTHTLISHKSLLILLLFLPLCSDFYACHKLAVQSLDSDPQSRTEVQRYHKGFIVHMQDFQNTSKQKARTCIKTGRCQKVCPKLKKKNEKGEGVAT